MVVSLVAVLYALTVVVNGAVPAAVAVAFWAPYGATADE